MRSLRLLFPFFLTAVAGAGCVPTPATPTTPGTDPTSGRIFRSQGTDEMTVLRGLLDQLKPLGFTCEVEKKQEFAVCKHPRRLIMVLEAKLEPSRLVHTATFGMKEQITCDAVSPKLLKFQQDFNHAILSCHGQNLVFQGSLFLTRAGFDPVEIDDYFKWWSEAVLTSINQSGLADDLP